MAQFGGWKYSAKVTARACAVMKITIKSSQIDCDWLPGLGVTSTYMIHFLSPRFPVFLIPWNKVGVLIHVGGMWPLM